MHSPLPSSAIPKKSILKKKDISNGFKTFVKTIDPQKRKQASKYLKRWHRHRDRWFFSKRIQTWLLKNMLDPAALNDKYFSIMIFYMNDMKGNARVQTLASCNKILDEYSKQNKNSVHKVDSVSATRAKIVLESLREPKVNKLSSN
ncbi:hypothetical protein ACOME3_001003 [Neoechinorhynchus agilis]